MRAVRLHAFREPLRYDTVPNPLVGPGEVLVEVAYAGVNPIDMWLTDGLVRRGTQQLPFVPGSDASGHVDGQPVVVHGRGMGVVRDGLYRELAAVPEEAIVQVPPSVDLQAAAAIGVPGTTAWLLVHELAPVAPPDRVLVLGCSGGVGSLIVQMARNRGAAILGHTSNPDKVPFIEEHLGCGVVVAEAAGLGAATAEFQPTVVFDPLGDGFTAQVAGVVAPGGVIVVFGTSSGPVAEIDLRSLYKRGVTLRTYAATLQTTEAVQDALRSVLAELEGGRVRPAIDSILPLSEAAEAHRRLRAREVKGKILLSPA